MKREAEERLRALQAEEDKQKRQAAELESVRKLQAEEERLKRQTEEVERMKQQLEEQEREKKRRYEEEAEKRRVEKERTTIEWHAWHDKELRKHEEVVRQKLGEQHAMELGAVKAKAELEKLEVRCIIT